MIGAISRSSWTAKLEYDALTSVATILDHLCGDSASPRAEKDKVRERERERLEVVNAGLCCKGRQDGLKQLSSGLAVEHRLPFVKGGFFVKLMELTNVMYEGASKHVEWRQTYGRGATTHGDVLNRHTEARWDLHAGSFSVPHTPTHTQHDHNYNTATTQQQHRGEEKREEKREERYK